MKLSYVSVTLASALSLALAVEPDAHSRIPANSTQKAVEFAYSYCYPLWKLGSTVSEIPENQTIPNRPYHNSEPADYTTGGVGKPNPDTLYSKTLLDLSHSDLELHLPAFPEDKFWVFPFYTPYGDDVVNLGSVNGTKPGRYLIQYVDGEYGYSENAPVGYEGVVTFPMVYGVSDMRIYTDRSEADVDMITKIQQAVTIKTVERPGKPSAPRFNLTVYRDPAYQQSESQSWHEAVFKTASQFADYLPPYIKVDRKDVSSKLKTAGVYKQHYVQPNGTNLTAAGLATNASMLAISNLETVRKEVGHNWTIAGTDADGVYYSDYLVRYLTATEGFLTLGSEQAVYASSTPSSFDVADGEAILFTFSDPPHVKKSGFWSLAVYGPDDKLIENNLDRYSITDASNLTYADGDPVTRGDPRPFQILLQSTEAEPPSNWTSNWLPITPGKTTLSTNMRWYVPEGYMTDGAYEYPKVEVIDQITK